MSPRIEKVATTGMGSSAQEAIGKESVKAARAVADFKVERRDVIVVLSDFKISAW
jgi:hypothetical protein